MQNREAWNHLSDDEKTIIAVKLTPNKKEGSSQKSFNDRFTGKNEQETAALVTAIQNLIDNAGGRSNSEVWRQIQSIDGGWVDEKNSSSAALSLTVSCSKDFLAVLRNNGYDVDRYYEFVTGHKHSARFITEYSYHPGMHFVQEHGYPDNRFDVHWDPRSSAFRKVSRWYYWLCALTPKIAERVVAGKTHNNPISAIQVRRELMKMGIVDSGNEQA